MEENDPQKDDIQIEVEMSEPENQTPELSDIQKKIQDDVNWLYLICPMPPKPEEVEAAIQSYSIMKSLSPSLKEFDTQDFIKLAITGWLASKARKADEKRFQNLDVFAFFNVAYAWTEPEDQNGDKYAEFIAKINPNL
jgi:hypothetical protein